MRNLFDIMREAQGGAGLTSLSRQFGLEPAMTQMAVEALLPAFSIALQRSMQHPELFSGLLQTMVSGAYAPFFEGTAGRAQTVPAGSDVIGQLFGTPEASRDIARRASQATGIGVQVLQEMMPVIGATLVGGTMRYATAEGFADLLRQWSQILKTVADKANPRPEPRPASDPWSAWLDMMGRMGMPGVPTPPPPAAAPSASDAWMRAMGAGAFLPTPAPSPAPAGAPNPFEALTRLFETGREVQAQYLASLQSLFPPPPGPKAP